MSVYFVDTSALAKRYIQELGSNWIQTWILAVYGHTIIISTLTEVEMMSLFARRQREKTLSPSTYKILTSHFQRHLQQEYWVFSFHVGVKQEAQRLVSHYTLKSLDAIQLGSALYASQTLQTPLTFVSADVALLHVASQEGFSTDNPNLYP